MVMDEQMEGGEQKEEETVSVNPPENQGEETPDEPAE